MLRTLPALLLAAGLLSCGSPAYLLTDAPFRAAFPEVVSAWKGLPFWSGARTADLPAGGPGLAPWLAGLPADAAVLVGAAVTDADRVSAGARVRFFGPPRDGSRSLSVRRADAWALVAGAAAAPGAAGWILFPPDASPDERRAAAEAWRAKAGTPAVEASWPVSGPVPPPPAVLLDFAGPEADQLVLGAAEGRPVHGDPGLPPAAGAAAATWTVKTAGLGDFLLESARNSTENVDFLPLETAPARR